METPILSTMVVLYTTNVAFDTTKLAESLPLTSDIIKVEKRGIIKRGESKRDRVKRRSTKPPSSNTTGFCNNSLTIVLLNDGDGELPKKEITVKIFQNGVFHMTGVLDDKYAHSTMRILMAALWADCKDSMKGIPDSFDIINRRIVLMNYTTKLSSNSTVPRELLHTNIKNQKLENVVSHYDPDVYPGVKICIGTGNWTAKVFRTGKIILTGIVSQSECSELISQLLALFEKVLPQMKTPGNMSTPIVPLLSR